MGTRSSVIGHMTRIGGIVGSLPGGSCVAARCQCPMLHLMRPCLKSGAMRLPRSHSPPPAESQRHHFGEWRSEVVREPSWLASSMSSWRRGTTNSVREPRSSMHTAAAIRSSFRSSRVTAPCGMPSSRPPLNETLKVGVTYDGATRSSGRTAGLSVSGDHRGCNEVRGSFQVTYANVPTAVAGK